ncbi:Do family serine endopeptidase [Sorangium sp. So ce375]|uniref:Do family serine endopeptidase n=1 Tax=Sorangium sp. So ce375 TaxID=3133306 RepID=UPI003F5C1D1B
MIQAVSYRSRASAFALLSAAALAIGGCGQQAHAAPPSTQAAAASPQAAAPPVSTVTLPPPAAPVPATFDVAALSERVRPMVVNITTTHEADGPEGLDPFQFFFGPQGGGRMNPRGGGPRPTQTALGTGFIIDPNGYVVTNEHVIHEASGVRVRLADEREFDAEVVGRDPKLDLALLRLKGASGLPVAPLGASEQLRVGEHVLAVGNPFGLGHTVTLGIVSAKARAIGAGPYDDFIQTDASINPGNSGGPLFNWRGEVVGINTAIRAGANGIGFAIPVDALKDVLPQLREKGFVERGKLGLLFQPVTRDLAAALQLDGPRGALVAEVEPGGAAARAGIKPGDVIVNVNGVPINHAEELRRNVARNAPGSQIAVTVVRAQKRQEIVAKLDALQDEEGDAAGRERPSQGARPERQQSAEKLGVQVSEAPGGGVRVDGFASGSNVQEIEVGDVILEVNGAPVKDVASLRAAVAKLKDGSVALLKVRRGKLVQFAAVPVPAR